MKQNKHEIAAKLLDNDVLTLDLSESSSFSK